MKKANIGVLVFIMLLVVLSLAVMACDKDRIDNNSDKKNDQTTSNPVSDDDSKSDDTAANTISDKVNLTIASINAKAGTTVTVPISFDTITEGGVGCCNFSIEYDETKIEFLEVIPGEIIGKADNLEYALDEGKGKISLLFASEKEEDAISRAGIFASVKFAINDNASGGELVLRCKAESSFGDATLERVEAVLNDGKLTIQ